MIRIIEVVVVIREEEQGHGPRRLSSFAQPVKGRRPSGTCLCQQNMMMEDNEDNDDDDDDERL